MALSGVTIANNCQAEFQELKTRKHVRYLIFKIENKKEIVIEKTGERSATYDDFCAALPQDEPRYAVCDVDHQTKTGQDGAKLVFFHWSPDGAPTMAKMLYASSKDCIKRVIDGGVKEVQANDNDDISFKEIHAILIK